METLPSGTVTFLFTDIEDSTRLWQEQPEAMASAHAGHDRILSEAVKTDRGHIFRIVRNSFAWHFIQRRHAVDVARLVLVGYGIPAAVLWLMIFKPF